MEYLNYNDACFETLKEVNTSDNIVYYKDGHTQISNSIDNTGPLKSYQKVFLGEVPIKKIYLGTIPILYII